MQQPDTTLPAKRDSAVPAKKPRRLSKKLIAAVDALADGRAKTQTEAAALVGIARETLSRALQRPDVQEELRARVEKQLKGKTLVRAAGKLDRLIDAQSENVSFRAVELTLGLNNFQPPQRGATVNASVAVGWVVDLRSDETKPGRMEGCTIIDVEPVEGDHGQ